MILHNITNTVLKESKRYIVMLAGVELIEQVINRQTSCNRRTYLFVIE